MVTLFSVLFFPPWPRLTAARDRPYLESMTRPIQSDGRMHGVVVGVRDDQGRWLMVRRSTTVTAPLKVCFPGGAVEVGESQEQAVVREMREELGVEVRPVRCVWRHEFPERNIVLWGWLGEIVSGDLTPDPGEIAEVMWLAPDEGSSHAEGLPTNAHFIAALACPPGTTPPGPAARGSP